MPPTADALLVRLEAAKGRYGRGAAAETKATLDQLSRQTFSDAKSLIRFHEALLFLRAFPQSPSLVPRIERLLNTFHERVEKLREAGIDMEAFDDFDTSGIAGTTMQDTLNFDAARWLVRRFPRNVEIAWEDYEEERAMGSTWPRFIPLLAEDATWKLTFRGDDGSTRLEAGSATWNGWSGASNNFRLRIGLAQNSTTRCGSRCAGISTI